MIFDILNQLLPNSIQLWPELAILIPFSVLMFVLRSAWFKGALGEWLFKRRVRRNLPKEQYHLINDVTLPTKRGSTQIDHIIVSPFGIFVIETKNLKGWIFGSRRRKTWTQTIYRRKYRFFNPLLQNYKHIGVLQNLLERPNEWFISVIAFVGSSVFKTPMPNNVCDSKGSVAYIQSKDTVLLSDNDIQSVIARIEALRLPKGYKTNAAHKRYVKQRKKEKQ